MVWSAPLGEQIGDQRGPASLMAGAEAPTGVAVKVLVEQHVVAPLGGCLEQLDLAVDRAAPVRTAQKNALQALRDLGRDLQQGAHLAGSGRALHEKVVTVIVVESLE